MEGLKEWVSSLFIIRMSLTFIEILLPNNSIAKYVKFIFSLLIMVTVLYPVILLINE